MKKTRGLSDKTSDVILVVFCNIIMLLVAYPLYYVLVASVSNPYDVYAGKTFLFPSEFTLKGYTAVFADDSLLRGFINSVKYTVIGTIFSVVMLYVRRTCPAGSFSASSSSSLCTSAAAWSPPTWW